MSARLNEYFEEEFAEHLDVPLAEAADRAMVRQLVRGQEAKSHVFHAGFVLPSPASDHWPVVGDLAIEGFISV